MAIIHSDRVALIQDLKDGKHVRQTTTVEAAPTPTGPWEEIHTSKIQISMDESQSPYATADITMAGPVPPILSNPTDGLPYVRITAGLSSETTNASEQLAILVCTGIDEDNGQTVLRLESDESPLEQSFFSTAIGESACPQQDSIGKIWVAVQLAIPIRTPMTIRDESTIPPEARSEVWSISYGGADSPLDWLRSLADAAGLYLRSDQTPSSQGGLVCGPRPQVIPAGALDLRTSSPQSLVINSSSRSGIGGGFGAAILLTCQWSENGNQKESSGIIPATDSANLAQVVKTIQLNMRPPAAYRSRITGSWPTAQALADRVAKRSWETTLITPCLPWLRPGDTVLTDKGPGLVKRLVFDLNLVTMTTTIRPA